MNDLHPERLAFIKSCRKDPSDRAPQLAFADWLDEHGDRPDDAKRAELIRVSCELDQTKLPVVGKAAQQRFGDCIMRKDALRTELGTWVCPNCQGRRRMQYMVDLGPPRFTFAEDAEPQRWLIREEPCRSCRGEGTMNAGAVLAWECGYPVCALVPNDLTIIMLSPAGGQHSVVYTATDYLKALVGPTPWGIPLDGVFPRDKQPTRMKNGKLNWLASRWRGRDIVDSHHVPYCVWHYTSEEGYRTVDEANGELALAYVRFARKEKP